ncbi:MAG: hypothetical protein Q9195_002406 [Heterodermia aff. obscurata]
MAIVHHQPSTEKRVIMSVVSTVTIHPTVTVHASYAPSNTLSTPSTTDNPKNSGLYPSGHGYGIAIWFGIASAMLTAILILAYLGWLMYKALKRSHQRRHQRRMREWYGRNMGASNRTVGDEEVELEPLPRPPRMRISG